MRSPPRSCSTSPGRPGVDVDGPWMGDASGLSAFSAPALHRSRAGRVPARRVRSLLLLGRGRSAVWLAGSERKLQAVTFVAPSALLTLASGTISKEAEPSVRHVFALRERCRAVAEFDEERG